MSTPVTHYIVLAHTDAADVDGDLAIVEGVYNRRDWGTHTVVWEHLKNQTDLRLTRIPHSQNPKLHEVVALLSDEAALLFKLTLPDLEYHLYRNPDDPT